MQSALGDADDVPVSDDPATTTLQAAIAGDELAFGHLYRSLQPPLLRYLRVVVRGEAEDVAGEVWLEVARDIRSFRGDPNGFRAWVFTIGRQRAIDLQRRNTRRPSVSVAEVPDSATTDIAWDGAMEAIGTAAAVALIARLPHDQAEAVMLRVVVGLDVADVARILGKRPGAVRVNTMRGLRALALLVGGSETSALSQTVSEV
jgi:RNA polymerase sigma-70 factor (ECF subfamily)